MGRTIFVWGPVTQMGSVIFIVGPITTLIGLQYFFAAQLSLSFGHTFFPRPNNLLMGRVNSCSLKRVPFWRNWAYNYSSYCLAKTSANILSAFFKLKTKPSNIIDLLIFVVFFAIILTFFFYDLIFNEK